MTEQNRIEIAQKYISEMEIIKLRTSLINNVRLKYLEPLVEFRALQLRKIIEQIILSSLIANADRYKEFYNRLEKDWNARNISRDLKRINPSFFPQAVTDDHDNHIITNKPDSLTCDELIKIYEKLGRLLHSSNPFNQSINYREFNVYIIESLNKIIRLLSLHTVKPYGVDGFILIGMSGTNNNGKAFANWFEEVK